MYILNTTKDQLNKMFMKLLRQKHSLPIDQSISRAHKEYLK